MRSPPRQTFDRPNSLRNIERFLALLATGPKTYQQISEALYMHDRNTRRYVAYLRKEPDKRVRVSGWIKGSNHPTPIFSLGSKPDLAYKPQSMKVTNAKQRAAVKADPVRSERSKLLAKARWMLVKAKRQPNTWASALFTNNERRA